MPIPRTKTIRHHQDLADLLGAADATEAAISRQVYKRTECGAWAALLEEPVTRRYRRSWQISVTRSILGPVVNLRRRPRGAWIRDADDLPAVVRDFLALDPSYRNRMVTTATWDEIEKVDLKAFGGRRQRSRHAIKMLVPFEEIVPTGRMRRGVAFGSIVEGIDATTAVHEVWYPAEAAEIEGAITAVETEAEDLWLEPHGCETCRAHWRALGIADGEGHARIWAECPDCKGDGVVL